MSWKYRLVPQESCGNTRPLGFISESPVYEVEMHNIIATTLARHRTLQIQATSSDLIFKNYFSPSVFSLVFLPKCCPFLFAPWVHDIRFLSPFVLARSQYSEGPATGPLDTGFSWFPCVFKQMLRWLPRFQVATTCFSCSSPNLNVNLSVTSFIFCLHVK